MSWPTWTIGVLSGIGAPLDAPNVDTVWAWSNAETAPYDLMRWNNPLNTTEKWPGSRDSGAQPGPHDVQIYASENDGILATIATLENGYYSAILANLRASLPRQQWGVYSTAGAELHLWGTGTNWLQATYGSAPGNIIGENMDQTTFDALIAGNPELGGGGYAARLDYALGLNYVPGAPNQTISQKIIDIETKLDAILTKLAPVSGGGGVEPTTLTLSIPAQTVTGKLS